MRMNTASTNLNYSSGAGRFDVAQSVNLRAQVSNLHYLNNEDSFSRRDG